jgi:hypothetical protein
MITCRTRIILRPECWSVKEAQRFEGLAAIGWKRQTQVPERISWGAICELEGANRKSGSCCLLTWLQLAGHYSWPLVVLSSISGLKLDGIDFVICSSLFSISCSCVPCGLSPVGVLQSKLRRNRAGLRHFSAVSLIVSDSLIYYINACVYSVL